ncbi:uncharacterized protein BDZ99DRAFT_145769 [Mytilinidion resinicola]|uniref:Rpr2-domain-containing protein n=1 Tax=Mytilinidion resinicola TaxID=574789 RepID=A0A6A6Y8P0_9PEZI|nr:uncharacterized protein BDZ99DRAFT_145769 [Mytilinidion resinicola]KAF2804918.1 hypothetical protein BDZ99DRAFT_145769 [Mytilinidion resinicola]
MSTNTSDRQALQSRLQYLKDAAHLLHAQSPTAAAVLGAQYDKLLVDRNLDLEASQKEWDSHRRDICGACGNLLIPGRSCQVSQESHSSKSSKAPKSKRRTGDVEKAMVYTCSRCDAKTVQPLQRPPKLLGRQAGISKSQNQTNSNPRATAISSDDTSTAPKSANASSKKRAKARKQGGLQALLDKSKSDTSKSRQGEFGLDLMDFMKGT